MKRNLKSINKIIGFIIFIFLIFFVFVKCTYLFRNTDDAGRKNIVGIKAEPENSLDVVFIGGSCVYRFWDTMRAYHEYGFTSYDYSVSGMAAASTITCIEDVLETQNPQLIVYDVRKLLSGYESIEIGRDSRNIFDSLDLGLNRLKGIHYFCRLNHIGLKEAVEGYIDLIEYHDNFDALADPIHWKFMDNRGHGYDFDRSSNLFKGFVVYARQKPVERPSKECFTDEIRPLGDVNDVILNDILEYCRTRGINLVLVASPYNVTDTNIAEMNYIYEVANSFDVPFINTNKCFDEMQLDFTRDFDDGDHVNNLGADKYTDFFAKYLVDNYNLPNHRSDSQYDSWEDIYQNYYLPQKNQAIENILWMIDNPQDEE